MKTLSRTCTAAGFAALLTFAGTAAAHAASATVPDEGTLLADGAGFTVSIEIQCDSGWTANVIADAAQTVDGNRVATGGGGSSTIECDGGAATVEVAILAAGDYLAFTEGDAVLRIFMITCGTATCEQVIEAGEIELTED
ncbi:hypothetical protein D477_011746 [Arthrobacter crystallopoietes BAB-32]|uniref:Lipoprotein n=1 Tax=Arthrobacter crystallopoietes BAB-32 TaxID=1246476 RepID=N1V1T0_9MICC|nr:hypothetical protein [Arthrobacter crystallopoietes]EMY34037.1 hypothetical protein D477_011746 [Arthrobacter crystallopoietes BAB-32]